MSDTTTAQDVKTVATQLAKIAAKSTAQTAVEMTAAFTVLAAVGFVIQKRNERRARKAAVPSTETE